MSVAHKLVAIGDVHGRADLLAALLAAVRAEHGNEIRFIFLGDLCDRGPSSAACYDMVLEVLEAHDGSAMLRGNHDEWLLWFLDEGKIDPMWFQYGATTTLASYGFEDITQDRLKTEDGRKALGRARHEIRSNFPGHLQMLKSSPLMLTEGPFALVHAGVDYKKPLDQQDRVDLQWRIKGFVDYTGENTLGAIVIHGHLTVGNKLYYPEIRANRIAVDTGAAMGPYFPLSALVIDLDRQHLSFMRAWAKENQGIEVRPIEAIDCAIGRVPWLDADGFYDADLMFPRPRKRSAR